MRSLRSLVAVMGLVAGFASGCQTYTQKSKDITQSWRQGSFGDSATNFSAKAEKAKNGNDAVIWRLEQAQALRATQKWSDSNAAFDAAEAKINGYDESAKVSISKETAALLSNQANLPYEGRDYDKVMLNAYKALNFLQLGEPDKARVELIRAYQRQQDAVENNKRRIEKTEEAANKLKESKEKGADQAKDLADKAKADQKFNDKLQSAYSDLDGLKLYADYVNPFVVYLDALFFMTAPMGASDLERSHKSFERVLGFTGENNFIKQDLETIDEVLKGGAVPPTTYIIFETGCAPIRDQIRIDVPLFFVGRGNVPYAGAAFPTLKFQENYLTGLTVTSNGKTETTVLLSSIDSVVGHSFKNELPTIITKTLLSTCVKAAAAYGINKAASNQDALAGLITKIATGIYQAAVNIADTRTWTTLPKEFQFCRIPTPVDHKIQLCGPSGEPKIEVTVEDGVNLVYVKSTFASMPLIVSQTKLAPSKLVAVKSDSPAESLAVVGSTESENNLSGAIGVANAQPQP
jgi:hypothetical protein